MKERINWLKNERARQPKNSTSSKFLNPSETAKTRRFHESFSEYSVTPLANLHNLANRLGVSEIFVKDESYRFGLNAFKVLGGSYAIGKCLAEKLNMDIDELPFERLKSKEVRDKIGQITFTSATDGNHGRGVAWTAQQLNQKAVIYMPKGSSEIRLNNIRATGAEASITDMNYDDAVRLSLKMANEHGWIVIQDTAWEGYTKIPAWIMQGYSTMLAEAVEQFEAKCGTKPTHVFVQAGVGALAGAVQGYLQEKYGDERPIVCVVEADKADCIFKTAKAGKKVDVKGDMNTIMAGLACGEVNPIGWNILEDYTDVFVSCSDELAAEGMRVLANPLLGDDKVVSGESGAVTSGLLFDILENEGHEDLKDALKLDENSKILLISTEGNTDPENYRKIVWAGAYPNVD